MKMLMTGALALTMASAGAVETSVDFTKETGALRPALHSSGWTPRSSPRAIRSRPAAAIWTGCRRWQSVRANRQ